MSETQWMNECTVRNDLNRCRRRCLTSHARSPSFHSPSRQSSTMRRRHFPWEEFRLRGGRTWKGIRQLSKQRRQTGSSAVCSWHIVVSFKFKLVLYAMRCLLSGRDVVCECLCACVCVCMYACVCECDWINLQVDIEIIIVINLF